MFNFPDNPLINDTFIAGEKTFQWDAEKWLYIYKTRHPVIERIEPTSIQQTSNATTLRVLGTWFTATCAVLIDDAPLPTVLISDTELNVANFPAGDYEGGTYTISVLDSHGQLTSNDVQLEIALVAPIISSLAPASLPDIGVATDTSFLIHGSNFTAQSVVFIDSVEAVDWSFTDAATMSATVNPNAMTAGDHPVQVKTGALQSALVPLTIALRSPIITSLDPASMPNTVDTATAFTIRGQNFIAESVVFMDGVEAPTWAFVDATTMTCTVTPEAMTEADHPVLVRTGTLSSAAFPFTVSSSALSSISPNICTMNEPVTLTVRGSGFNAGSIVLLNGAEVPTTLVSDTQLTATVTCPYGAEPTTWPAPPLPHSINVVGSNSPNLTLMANEPRCKIRSMYPDYYSSFFPLEHDVEVWCWGLISDQSVVYLDGKAGATKCELNGVGTEMILIFDIEPIRPPNDKWCDIQVLNGGLHWSFNTWSYYCDMDIGKGPPERRR